MKAITLWEPWASLVRCKAKTIETRSWATSYRGSLLICAAKGGLSLHDLTAVLAEGPIQEGLAPLLSADTLPYLSTIGKDDLNYGKMVCRATLSDCKRTDFLSWAQIGDNWPLGNFSVGRYAWILIDIVPVIMIPVRGSQGFFDIADELIEDEICASANKIS